MDESPNKKEIWQSKDDGAAFDNALMKEALRQADRKKWAAMLNESDDIKNRGGETVKKLRPPLMRRLAPYAIGAAAAIALLIMFVTPKNASFDEMVLNDKRMPVEVRMGANNDEKTWKDAMAAYRKNDFERTTQLLSALESPNSEQRYFLALSNIYQKNPDFTSASVIFGALVAQKDPYFEEEARWHLAFCQYKMKDATASRATLNEIVKNKGYNYQKAEKLLAKMK